MAEAKYWRLIALRSGADGDLELSALHLYSSGLRIDAGAEIASSIPPTSGDLGALSDGHAETSCSFSAEAVRSPGFGISWVFLTPVSVDGLRLGAGVGEGRFLSSAIVQSSADGVVWDSNVLMLGRFGFPGDHALTAVYPFKNQGGNEIALLLEGEVGSTSFPDLASKFAQTVVPGVSLSAARAKFGTASALFTGGCIRFGKDASTSLDFGVADFCIQAWCFDGGAGQRRVLFGNGDDIGGAKTLSLLISTGNVYEINIADGKISVPSAPTGVWYHFALSRLGDVVTAYVDGKPIGYVNIAGRRVGVGGGRFALGSNGDYSHYHGGAYGVTWVGHVQDFNVTTGTSVYSAPFEPPTTPFAGASSGYLRYPVRGWVPKIESIAAGGGSGSLVGAHQSLLCDIEDGGTGELFGTVQQHVDGGANLRLRRRVRLHDQRSGRLIRETWSDPVTGAYRFTDLKIGPEYCAIAFDHEGQFTGVVADRLQAEVMS